MFSKPGYAYVLIRIVLGCIIFGVGFNLFLEPNSLNAGGISGLSMVLTQLFGVGTVGLYTALFNLPLFAFGGWRIGRRFFCLSFVGMLFCATAIDVFSMLPKPTVEPLIGALYGGLLCGFGLGIVFSTGGSTGGSDIIVRLIKMKQPDIPIGVINICFDFTVAVLTGVVFSDIRRTLYSGVAIFISGRVMDAVIYRFDFSRIAFIISKEHQTIASEIAKELNRGATYLHGEGSYSHDQMEIILTAVKRQQLAELKRIVARIDKDAFIIVQEAHQVLGDGFARYSKDTL